MHVHTLLDNNVSDNITSFKSDCIAIYLRFTTLSSWISFCEKYLSDVFHKAFSPLTEELRNQLGLERVEIEVVMCRQDFLRSTKDISKQ